MVFFLIHRPRQRLPLSQPLSHSGTGYSMYVLALHSTPDKIARRCKNKTKIIITQEELYLDLLTGSKSATTRT